MHPTLFLTLAAVALGASARLNGEAQATSGNVLSSPSIAARNLDEIDAHLFEHNFVEANLERRQAMPDISQISQVGELADPTKLADVTKSADVTKIADASKIVGMTKAADLAKLNRRKIIEVKLSRRNDATAQARAHTNFQRRHMELEKIVSDANKLIDHKLRKRADIKDDVSGLKDKINDLVNLNRRQDLGQIVDGTRAMIDVELFHPLEDAVWAHAVVETNLRRRQDLEKIVSDANKLIGHKLRKRADIKDDVNRLKDKINDLVNLNRRQDLGQIVDEARPMIEVELFRPLEDAVWAHAVVETNLRRRQDLEKIVSDANKLIDHKLRKRADIKDDVNRLKDKINDLVNLNRSGLNQVTIPQPDDAHVVQKRKRTIEGTRIAPRKSDDDDDYYDDYYDDDVDTQDKKEGKNSSRNSKKHSNVSSTLKHTAGLSLVGVAISSLFLWV